MPQQFGVLRPGLTRRPSDHLAAAAPSLRLLPRRPVALRPARLCRATGATSALRIVFVSPEVAPWSKVGPQCANALGPSPCAPPLLARARACTACAAGGACKAHHSPKAAPLPAAGRRPGRRPGGTAPGARRAVSAAVPAPPNPSTSTSSSSHSQHHCTRAWVAGSRPAGLTAAPRPGWRPAHACLLRVLRQQRANRLSQPGPAAGGTA